MASGRLPDYLGFGLLAARPAAPALAAGCLGLWFSTDTGDFSVWTTAWTGLAGGGTVSNVVAGPGLAGGTITGTGTISLGTIVAASILGNSGGAGAVPAGVPLGNGLGFSTGTLAITGVGALVLAGFASVTVPTPTAPTHAVTKAYADAIGTGAVYTGTGGVAITGTSVALAAAANLTIKANVSGVSAAPTDQTLLAIFDAIIGWNQGDVLVRGAAGVSKIVPGVSGQALISQGTSVVPAFGALPAGAWGATAVTALGAGLWNTAGVISSDKAVTIAATATGTIDPTAGAMTVVTMGTVNTTLTMLPGTPRQKHRVAIVQGATAHTVTLDATFGFGTDVTAYVAGTVVSKVDNLQLLLNSTGSIGVVSGVSHSNPL